MFVLCVYHFCVGFKPIKKNALVWGRFPPKNGPNITPKCTHEFMVDFCLQSHRPILYLERQQKVHPAKRFEILRSRQHGLLGNMDNKSGGAELWISRGNTGMELDTFNYNKFFFLFFCKTIKIVEQCSCGLFRKCLIRD